MKVRSSLISAVLCLSALCSGNSTALAQQTESISAVIRCNGNPKYKLQEWTREIELILRDGKGTYVRSGLNSARKKFRETWEFDALSAERIIIRAVGTTEGVNIGHEITFFGKAFNEDKIIKIKGQQRNGKLITRSCEATLSISNSSFRDYSKRIHELRERQIAIEQRQNKSEQQQFETDKQQKDIRSRQSQLAGTVSTTKQNVELLNKKIGDLQAQIATLQTVLNEQKSLKVGNDSNGDRVIDETIEAIEAQIIVLKKDFVQKEAQFSQYITTIKPADKDLYLTARKASEIYPRIPYYIPGTNETGEFWVEPTVSDRGEMIFHFNFVDLNAYVQKIRGKISMSLAEIEALREGLLKTREWSILAHKNKIRRYYEKRVVCFPTSECPMESERRDGASSTELKFQIFDDGSTAGSIQRNKGRFVENYNVSIPSALLLQAYLNHVIKEAKLEYRAGTRDKKELDALFR